MEAPITIDDGGDEKLRRFAAALCNVSGADGKITKEELAFTTGYPQSIIDDIPKICKASEPESPEDARSEIKELVTMGTLKKTLRRIVNDAIRDVGADGLGEREKAAIVNVSKALGVSSEELDTIHALVEKEKELKMRGSSSYSLMAILVCLKTTTSPE